MTKTIVCPACDGAGWSRTKICERCHGTGNVKRPMTNGDRIRSMADEELALLMGFESCPESRRLEPCDEAKCYECWLDWLRQIAEEGV